MKKKVQIGVKFGDFFSHKNQTMPTVGCVFYCGTPLKSYNIVSVKRFKTKTIKNEKTKEKKSEKKQFKMQIRSGIKHNASNLRQTRIKKQRSSKKNASQVARQSNLYGAYYRTPVTFCDFLLLFCSEVDILPSFHKSTLESLDLGGEPNLIIRHFEADIHVVTYEMAELSSNWISAEIFPN